MHTVTLTLTRIYLAVLDAVEWTLARLAPRPQYATVSRTRRGAGLIEYALLAALAVGLFLIIRTVLNGGIGDKFRDVLEGIGISSSEN